MLKKGDRVKIIDSQVGLPIMAKYRGQKVVITDGFDDCWHVTGNNYAWKNRWLELDDSVSIKEKDVMSLFEA